MTSKISIDNRKLLQKISSGEAAAGIDFGNAIVRELAAFRLAAMDNEPVAYIDKQWTLVYYVPPMSMGLKIGDKLYRHAQPAPVVPDDNGLLPCPFCGGEPEEDAGGCIEYHGHEHQDYSITCKQCGAEVYCSVGTFEKADVTCSCHHDTRRVCVDKWNKRAAMLQAGNSPVIPDGLIAAVNRLLDSDGSRGCYSAIQCGDAHDEIERLLAAAPHDTPALNSVQSVVTVPGKWIPVSERVPENDGAYLCWDKRYVTTYAFIFGAWQVNQFIAKNITHWMPLPAAPQEVKSES